MAIDVYTQLLSILHNPVQCGTDDLLVIPMMWCTASFFIHFQPIPSLLEGHDRDAGVGFEHFADIGYLDVEGEGVGITIVSPNVFQQIGTLYGLADMLG